MEISKKRKRGGNTVVRDGRREWEIIPNGHRISFWDDEIVLKLDSGDGSPGEGNGNPFQYSCLENSMDRGAWWATVHGVGKSWT